MTPQAPKPLPGRVMFTDLEESRSGMLSIADFDFDFEGAKKFLLMTPAELEAYIEEREKAAWDAAIENTWTNDSGYKIQDETFEEWKKGNP